MKKIGLIIGIMLMLASCGGIQPEKVETLPTPTGTTDTTIILGSAMTETMEAVAIEDFEAEPSPIPPPADQGARSIILFIGDGMGPEHRLAGQYLSVGVEGELVMDTLPVSGWLQTDSIGGILTDSAAGATALATGQQTYNDVISMDTKRNQLKTILEYAQELEMSVGLVSTKYITDATTAAFGAHVWSREMGPEIASQFLEHGVDVILGGGENDFLPRGVTGCHPETGDRTDELNLIEEAEVAGYTFVCDEQAFDLLDPQSNPLVIGIFADESMQRPYAPSLADMTQTAIDILSLNPNGFFLLVEGGMIDIAVGLDQAVEVGLEYAESDASTLIIVTADHETGGLSVYLEPLGTYKDKGPFYMPDGTDFYVSWGTSQHTDADVPVSAYGPGSEMFIGTNGNTIVFDVMLKFLGFKVVEE